MNVLIVEDDAAAREASSRYLDDLGFETRTASNASEAEYQASNERPDVVICDWRLADAADGADVARSLQKKYDSLIIFITAQPLQKLRNATRDIKVVRYLRKPISLHVLAGVLRDVRRGHKKSQ